MNGFRLSITEKDKAGGKHFNVPDVVVLLFAPIILCLFPFLPFRMSVRFRLSTTWGNGTQVTVYPLWRIAYGHYRKWRMGRYRKAKQ